MLGPIFAREFRTVPRREQHYAARSMLVGGLWTLGITAWLATNGLGESLTLGETARFGRLLFQVFSIVLLALTVFFAALSAAGTVAREKDRRTFVLLLLTDLRDYEIVLGKLLGSLLPIGLMLLAALPLLFVLTLLGGVSFSQVIASWLIIAATGIAAGSIGGLIALWRDRMFQSLALSVLSIVMVFGAVHGLSAVGQAVAPSPIWNDARSVLDPFTAMANVLEPPMELGGGWSTVCFAAIMLGFAAAVNLYGIAMLRVWNPGGEPIMQRETPGEESVDAAARAKAHAAPGKVRSVWENPILWREIRTRAYGARPILVKGAYFVVLFLVAYAAFSSLSGPPVPFQAALGLVPISILSLLLVAAQSATAITSERDGGSLDLLLVTDLSPREFIFGKLGGIIYNTKEYLVPPLVAAIVYAAIGRLATPPRSAPDLAAALNAQSLAAIGLGLLVVMTFVLVLGLFLALRVVNSRQAIANTLGTVFFLSVGTIVCIYLIWINRGTFEYQFMSFSIFLIAGIGGLWWVLSAELPSPALTLASVMLPLAVFYAITNVLVARPGTDESAAPLVPFLVVVSAFGFALAAMLVPLLSEFDIALGRTRAGD